MKRGGMRKLLIAAGLPHKTARGPRRGYARATRANTRPANRYAASNDEARKCVDYVERNRELMRYRRIPRRRHHRVAVLHTQRPLRGLLRAPRSAPGDPTIPDSPRSVDTWPSIDQFTTTQSIHSSDNRAITKQSVNRSIARSAMAATLAATRPLHHVRSPKKGIARRPIASSSSAAAGMANIAYAGSLCTATVLVSRPRSMASIRP